MDDLRLKALLSESDHATQSIHRSLTTVYGSWGILVPGLTGLCAVLARQSAMIELVMIVFLVAFTIISLYVNTVWLQFFPCLTYKFEVLIPRIRELVGFEEFESLGQHMYRRRPKGAGLPLAALTLFLTSLPIGLTYYVILCKPQYVAATWIGTVSSVLVLMCNAITLRHARGMSRRLEAAPGRGNATRRAEGDA